METSPDFKILNTSDAGDRFFIAGIDKGIPGDALLGLYATNNREAFEIVLEHLQPDSSQRRYVWVRHVKAQSWLEALEIAKQAPDREAA